MKTCQTFVTLFAQDPHISDVSPINSREMGLMFIHRMFSVSFVECLVQNGARVWSVFTIQTLVALFVSLFLFGFGFLVFVSLSVCFLTYLLVFVCLFGWFFVGFYLFYIVLFLFDYAALFPNTSNNNNHCSSSSNKKKWQQQESNNKHVAVVCVPYPVSHCVDCGYGGWLVACLSLISRRSACCGTNLSINSTETASVGTVESNFVLRTCSSVNLAIWCRKPHGTLSAEPINISHVLVQARGRPHKTGGSRNHKSMLW